MLAVPGVVRAQDELGGAKTLYVNASYEEALSVLDKQVATAATGARAAEVQHYRALCFIALGRTTEADQAIALSVTADPFAVPDTSELSPRVASVFTAARARIIPEVARSSMNEGRQMMLKGDAAGAHRQFEAVTKLLSDPGLAGRADLNDLTMAATAFSELTKAQIAQAAAAAAAAAAPAPAPQANALTEPSAASNGGAPATAPNVAAPGASRTPSGAQPPPAPRPATTTALRATNTTSTRPATPAPAPPGFVPAVPIAQALPAWTPPTGAIAQLGFSGGVRVTIDASGHVTGAVMEPSVYPPYDRLVLAAAKEWTYRPATQNGQPVASERRVEIVLKPRN